MVKKTIAKNHVLIPDGMSEDADTSDFEDETKKIQEVLKNQLVMNNNSSSSETSDSEERMKQKTSKFKSQSKKKKRIHWVEKPFMPPTSTFVNSLPPPSINTEPEPIDYFYMMFGKESFNLLKDQSNLYSVQVNQNRPANISEIDIHQFIGISIMTGVHSVPHQRFY